MITMEDNKKWTLVIKPGSKWFNINLHELLRYKGLIYLFIKRDFVTFYKQTILGPLWYIIQPLANTVILTIIFGKIAEIPTDDIPPFLFYMAGTVVWGYFSTCLIGTSNTFVENSQIFGKVYFPRLTVPISVVMTGLFQFGIQVSLFLLFYLYYWVEGSIFNTNISILFFPLVVLQMAALGLGFGILISSLVTKYRDLTFAMTFVVQIWMYLSPIVYPLTEVPESYRLLYSLNPMVSVVESFRGMFLGQSSLELSHVIVGAFVTIVVVFFGVVLFSKTESNFMDTV